VGDTCPADAKSTGECRAAAGVCDIAEFCDGASDDCPADVVEPATLECRPSAGICDAPDFCTGSSGSCPADDFLPDTTLCRDLVGICDVAEFCTGSTAACPSDAFEPSSFECQPSAGSCDVPEFCTGSSAVCPANAKRSDECRASAGGCDPAEFCDGVGDTCPADAKSTGECRAAAGPCDIAEFCDGANDNCPADVMEPATLECRPSAGSCDVTEFCTGSSVACPANVFEPVTFECRTSAGVCDVAEFCTGIGPTCPLDAKSIAECRASAGPCDLAEFCDGVGDTCAADAKSTAQCRASAGPCDIPEFCDGVADTCPAVDGFEPATTECRAKEDGCDVPEFCTGSGPACPTDGFEIDGTPCDDLDDCTVDDICGGGVCQGDSGLDGLATCGDGIRRSVCGEECDDENLEDCDGCSSRCQVEHAPCGLQSPDQEKCIAGLNKALVSVAKAQDKAISKCIKAYADDKLGQPIEDCLTSDPSGRVAKAKAKTNVTEIASCIANPPGFGARDADTVNEVAVRKEIELIDDLFGSDLDAVIFKKSDNKDASKCQQAVEKAMQKCTQAKLKEFAKCKKIGLKEASITDAASLRSACVGVDPKGKIAKACNTVNGRVRVQIIKRCVHAGVDLAQLFPGCNINDERELAVCIERLTECHVCLALAEADDFGPAICDLVDDGSENSSCGDLEPADIGANCGPGPHWVDGPCDPGLNVLIGRTAFIGIDFGIDCVPDLSLTLSGDAVIGRSGPIDQSLNFPGPSDCGGGSCGSIDAHLDVVDTEIISMTLTGGGVVLRLGDDTSVPIPASLGTVVEKVDAALAESFFDLFVELEVAGLVLYNHAPMRLQAEIRTLPPDATYVELAQCVPLFDHPLGGVQMGALVFAEYNTNRCGNGLAGDQEACDGTDDAACPGQCQSDCTCP
jgi:cysteine-rich repeat protein